MFCSKCGTKIEDGNFCPVCGAPVTGTQNNAGSEENVQMKAPVQTQVPKQAVPPVNTGAGSGNGGKNGNHTAVIMIAVIAVLAVAVIGLLCGVVFSCASQKESGSAQAVSQESTEETDTAATEESAEAAPETSVDETTSAATADSAEAVSAETAGQNAETSMDPSKLSDDIYSFQCVINNKLYQFPMTYSDFMARGLTIDEYSDDASSLKANSYGLVYYDDEDGNQICVYMYNPAKSEAAIDKCIISGVKYDSYDMKNDKGSMLPGNLAVGKATLDDVTRAYGEASDEYDSDLKDSNRKTLTYTGDTYERVEIVFDDGKTMSSFDIENIGPLPEGMDESSLSTGTGDKPASVDQYKAPTKMSDSFTDYVVSFDGDLYQLPCPLQALLDNGWKIDTDSSAKTVAGNDGDFVDIKRNNKVYHTMVKNYDASEQKVENCYVTTISGMDMTSGKTDIELAGGIKIGTSQKDLEAALKKMGVEYKKEKESSYVNYSLEDDNDDAFTYNYIGLSDGKVNDINIQYEPDSLGN